MIDLENAVLRRVTHKRLRTVVSGIAEIERRDGDEMQSEEWV
jgi:hypothetical protein